LGEQLAAAQEYADIFAVSAPLVVETIKSMVAETVPRGPAETAAITRDQLLAVRDSEDGAEGRAAFKGKRPPEFHGR